MLLLTEAISNQYMIESYDAVLQHMKSVPTMDYLDNENSQLLKNSVKLLLQWLLGKHQAVTAYQPTCCNIASLAY